MYKERNRTYNINQDYPCLNEKNLDDISTPPIRNNHAIQLYQKKKEEHCINKFSKSYTLAWL